MSFSNWFLVKILKEKADVKTNKVKECGIRRRMQK